MTSRERFHLTMTGGKPDRIPYFEEGLRSDVIRVWHTQGLSPDLSELKRFQTDRFKQLLPEVGPIPDLRKWPAQTEALNDLGKRFDEDSDQRLPENWHQQCMRWQTEGTVIFLRIHRGLFQTLGIYKWNRFNEVMSMLIENPRIIEKIMEIHTQFILRLLKKILGRVSVDGVIFSEPISGSEGPLISPEMYERFALSYYREIINGIRNSGIKHIIFRTYSNTRIFIPKILEYGFDTLWACETNSAAMDYPDIRKEYGRELKLIGGIDLDSLREGQDAIKSVIDRVVPGLLTDGSYIPLADGRMRRDVSLENYLYYRNYLQKTIEETSVSGGLLV